jgi:nitroreductase
MARSPSRWNTPLIMVPRVAPTPILPLNPDELLSTTRAVRKRLDFDRPVSDDVIRECVALAMQSPSGSNAMTMQFVVVRDPAKKQAIGEVYRTCFGMYRTWDGVYIGSIDKGSDEMNAQQARSAQSADYLGDRMGDAPALVIACSTGGRVDGQPAIISANRFGNVLPAMWSFMLAARARGLGTCWTTLHLIMEQQIADILGIPFDDVTQAVLSPLAYTVGTDFRPATRPDPDTIIHWDQW